jgi:O-antigen ligase
MLATGLKTWRRFWQQGRISLKKDNLFYGGWLILPLAPAWGTALLFIVLARQWRRHFQDIVCDRLAWGLGAITLWLALTTAMAVYPLEALAGLANFLPYFLVFLAFRFNFVRWRRLQRWAECLILPALPIALLGLGQLFLGWDSGDMLRRLGFSLVGWGRPEGRLSSVFIYANLCAAYFLVVIPLAMGLGIEAWRQWQRQRNRQFRDRAIALLIVIIGCSVSLVLTDSRNGWGIFVLIGLAFALYLGWRHLVMAIAAVSATIAWAAWGTVGAQSLRQIVPAFLWARLNDEEFGDRADNALRTTQWQFIGEMVQKRPVFGFGLRNFTPLYKQTMHLWMGHPHSFPLMILGETGIPGLILLLAWVGWIVVQGSMLCQKLTKSPHNIDKSRALLLFSYLVSFLSLSAFNLLDVTIFDLRLNLLGWSLLAAIASISSYPLIPSYPQKYGYNPQNLKLKSSQGKNKVI